MTCPGFKVFMLSFRIFLGQCNYGDMFLFVGGGELQEPAGPLVPAPLGVRGLSLGWRHQANSCLQVGRTAVFR